MREISSKNGPLRANRQSGELDLAMVGQRTSHRTRLRTSGNAWCHGEVPLIDEVLFAQLAKQVRASFAKNASHAAGAELLQEDDEALGSR